jgi:hypothetical protein
MDTILQRSCDLEEIHKEVEVADPNDDEQLAHDYEGLAPPAGRCSA